MNTLVVDTPLLKTLSDNLVDIAYEAGKAILEVYHSDDFNVESKADDSPLTRADKMANDVICQGLEKLDTIFPIISEENKEIPYDERKAFTNFWLVDPLDGTKEFIKRNGEFTVNIALISDQSPILGVVYAPELDQMYWAAKGIGSFLRKDGKDHKLSANHFQMSDDGLKVVCSRSHMNDDTKNFVGKLTNPALVPTGSSLKFLIIANGQADIYPRMGPTMEWDTGAAHIVLEEAGGSVIDQETNQPLRYNKTSLLNPYFLAMGNLQDLS